ncbi:MAG: CSLREA domain-containing protein [Acidobacteria bacterium]|nr:CSLREA domain-containing protein [Acidobacteriota bacterium]
MNLTHNPRFLFIGLCCAVTVGLFGYWRVQAQQGAHPFYRSAAMPAMFAILTVTKTADTNDGVCDADCSLREAIAAANANDTIQFSALFNAPQTITLALGELAINQSLTIQGPGANLLTVSGNNAVRVFRTTAGDVAISGLTIANGNAAGDLGGGLRKQGAGSVTLTNCAITGNRAEIGAGLFFDDGTVDIIGCTINDNAAANTGGALSNQGATLRMTNCTVTGTVLMTQAAVAMGYISREAQPRSSIAPSCGTIKTREAILPSPSMAGRWRFRTTSSRLRIPRSSIRVLERRAS